MLPSQSECKESQVPFFSVIVPTHNRPKLLERALLSVVEQDFDDFEIVVVNDGSSVSYEDVIQKYGASIACFVKGDFPVGVAGARNKGIRASSGRWTVFLDDDDELESGYLTYLNKYITDNRIESAILWSSIKHLIYDRAGRQMQTRMNVYSEEHKTLESVFLSASCIGASFGVAISRDLYAAAGLFDESYGVGEDTEFILRLLDAGARPYPLSRVGIIKHDHENARLSSGFSAYSQAKVYERIIAQHGSFLTQQPRIYKQMSAWSACIHFRSGNFRDGDAMLARLLKVKPFSASSVGFYTAARITRLVSRSIWLKSVAARWFN